MGLFFGKKREDPFKKGLIFQSDPTSEGHIVYMPSNKYFQKEFKKIMESDAVPSMLYSKTKKELLQIDLRTNIIFKYKILDLDHVTLVSEPKNKADPNAIMILYRGYKIGYIPAAETSQMRDMARHHRIRAINCSISGGPARCILGSSVRKDDQPYRLNMRIVFK